MNKYLLIGVLLLAALFRLPSLNSHMPALYGDEISIAYNAYSILQAGKDEFGRFMPIQFESWGDQKNPVYIYLTTLFQTPFGLSEWSVRLPSAIAGIVAVYLTFLLTKLLLTQEKRVSERAANTISILAAALLAINPWHIHISRGGYEANLALTLGLAAVYLIIKYFISQKTSYLYYALIPAILAMYTYYTTKLFLPLLLLIVFAWGYVYFSKSKEYITATIKFFVAFIFFCLPIAYLALFSQGQARFQSINIFANPTVENRVVTARNTYGPDAALTKVLENKYTYYLRDFLEYYFENLSGQFAYTAGDSSLRYSMRDHGMFYLIELPFVLLGWLLLFKHNKKIWTLLTLWLLLAPFPTALVGRAYGLRSLAILPIPFICASYGICHTVNYLKSRPLKIMATATLSLIFIVSALNWTLRYSNFYPAYGQYWYDSMQKEAIEYAKSQESNYDAIVISKFYGKTEMYYAFYAKVPPADYQVNSQKEVQFLGSPMVQFGKYYFGDIKNSGQGFSDLHLPPRTLVIAAPSFPYGQETITAKDDKRPLFKVIKN